MKRARILRAFLIIETDTIVKNCVTEKSILMQFRNREGRDIGGGFLTSKRMVKNL